MKTKKWTVKELKDEARSLHQQIYQIGCYGSHDLQMYDWVLNELENRGIEVSTKLSI